MHTLPHGCPPPSEFRADGPVAKGIEHDRLAPTTAGTPDEVGTLGALLMGPDSGFITGSDILIDGGVTASYFYGELAN